MHAMLITLRRSTELYTTDGVRALVERVVDVTCRVGGTSRANV